MIICNGPKRIISFSGGFGMSQMVLESDIEWYANKDARPQRRWGGSYIGWREEQIFETHFKTVRLMAICNEPK